MSTSNLPVRANGYATELPAAPEIETRVLGAALTNIPACQTLLLLIRNREVFHDERHQWVHQAIQSLAAAGEPANMLTLKSELEKLGVLKRVGGVGFIAGLTEHNDSVASQAKYCRILQQEHIRRTIIQTGRELTAYAVDHTRDSLQLLATAQHKLTALHQALEVRPSQTVADCFDETFAQLAKAVQVRGLTGIPTGLTQLDRLLGGWQPSDLIIVAARPGIGKTTALLHFARTAALLHERHVAFFSLEMARQQLMQRLVASEVPGYSTAELRCGRLLGGLDEVAHIAQQAQQLRSLGHHLVLDDTAGLTINQLRAKCVHLHAQRPLDLIVIDYLQLMHGDGGKNMLREREVSSISQGLKELAKELNVPIITLSQLSRSVEQRGGDKRPILSDLRESGSLEQDADCIIFLWRGEAYGITEYSDGTPTTDTMLLDVAKHRNGPVGHLTASCNLKRNVLADF